MTGVKQKKQLRKVDGITCEPSDDMQKFGVIECKKKIAGDDIPTKTNTQMHAHAVDLKIFTNKKFRQLLRW